MQKQNIQRDRLRLINPSKTRSPNHLLHKNAIAQFPLSTTRSPNSDNELEETQCDHL
ncbi:MULTISPECIES: hypothetical protein [Pseudanabaena]|uniref:hypothetical protein n=1 Tax=Pseudanabaena TaxID=1152 RepID=UPI00247A80B2|nr:MULTISPECIES: hypothetical protein [Pseudanabaena]MEA5486195.1 hypothetical protein [Pseudanabaena sp. CCNP1317]WGS70571.1 hypothetical protein OA858_12605 [Pseudanabaena galeata CCNP1313]